MPCSITILAIFLPVICLSQTRNIAGTFGSFPNPRITFNPDSTFKYISPENPNFFHRREGFAEKGRWTILGDTIILNPNLSIKPFVESELREQEISNSSDLSLTFNHIKRYIDSNGNITGTDTSQIERLDYCFNKFKKKDLTRVSSYRSSRCAFAGYIPREIITTDRTIFLKRPSENIKSIFIGCYEQKGTREFVVKDPNSNHLIFNVYSNYYQYA